MSMNQNARSTLSTILIQLGFSDDDIFKLMGNYRVWQHCLLLLPCYGSHG